MVKGWEGFVGGFRFKSRSRQKNCTFKKKSTDSSSPLRLSHAISPPHKLLRIKLKAYKEGKDTHKASCTIILPKFPLPSITHFKGSLDTKEVTSLPDSFSYYPYTSLNLPEC